MPSEKIPQNSLRTFLTLSRTALRAPAALSRNPPPTFIVGNESADLDSLCSTLILAYLRTYSTQTPHPSLEIPIANLHRPDLALRPELRAVLRRAGLDMSHILTLTELEEARGSLTASKSDEVKAAEKNFRWLLVDHNAPTGFLKERYGSQIVGCVDHHQDEGVVPKDTGNEPRIIQRCGSCMSLVVANGMHVWKRLVEEKADRAEVDGPGDGIANAEAEDLDAQLAYVVLGPILIDTTNLTDEDKTTATDLEVAEFAEGLIRRAGIKYDRDAYHAELVALKEDLSSLSYRDIFRKDYKKWTDGGLVLGASSVAQSVDYLLDNIGDKDKFLSELRKWAEEEKLDIACVMTTLRPNGGFARELMVWGLNGKAVEVVKDFVANNSDNLRLETLGNGKLDDTSGSSEWRACWKQLNTKASRKQVGPMLREAMKAVSK